MIRKALLAASLVFACSAHAAQSQPAPDVAVDPAGAWRRFLAEAEFHQVYDAYDVLPNVFGDDGGIDADRCRANASGLAAAGQAVPVSLLIRRTAMQCAEALHDDAAAERELKAIASLAKHALAGANEGYNARPIPVVRNDDAGALLESAGLQVRYTWFPGVLPTRYLPMYVAAWDPEQKVERVFRFDFIDVAARLMREPGTQHPFMRNALAQGLADKAGGGAASDLAGVHAALAGATPADRLAALRASAAAGGIQSLSLWIKSCVDKQAPSHCADGLADALLPHAEQEHTLPMTLLAYVYGNGMGVKRDADSARRLLAAADARRAHFGASVDYADLWTTLHPEKPLPAELRATLERARDAGNPNAALMLFRDFYLRDPMKITKPIPKEFVDMLSSPVQNGMGEGFGTLSVMVSIAAPKDAPVYARKAAEAGHPDYQWKLGHAMWTGEGVPKDQAAGQRMIVDAANAGHARSARHMAYRAMDRGDWKDAEAWVLGAAQGDDVDAILLLAGFYEWSRPGVGGTPQEAADLYRALIANGNAEARVRLSNMMLVGRGVAKDVAGARALLVEGAEGDQAEAQARLAMGLLRGDFGNVDEREGVKWAERAMDEDAYEIAAAWGHWLYYKKGTPDARRQAIGAWERGMDDGDDTSANNLAWARCTSAYDDELDPEKGLVAVTSIGTDSSDFDAGELDTAAACQAANREFQKARTLQALAMQANAKERAIAVARNASKATLEEHDATAKEFAERMALYASGKAYRETTSAQ